MRFESRVKKEAMPPFLFDGDVVRGEKRSS